MAYERAVGAAPAVAAARRRGEAYLLDRGLFRRRSTGVVADPAFLAFAFPPRYYYDVLRGLDYLRDAGVTPDERLADAIAVVADKRHADGRWRLNAEHSDGLDFPLGERIGEPSRWNSLRALCVLAWYERARS